MDFEKHAMALCNYISSHENVFNSLICGIVIIEPHSNRIAYVNETAERIIGMKKEFIIGKCCFEQICNTENTCSFAGLNTDFCTSEGMCNGKTVAKSFYEVVCDGKQWRVESFVDVSSYMEKQIKLEYIGYHDALTGLFNRTYIYKEIIEKEIFIGKQIGVMVIDIDELKSVNDRFGHVIGDEIIKKTAGLLQNNIQGNAVAARIGGDEFLVVMEIHRPEDIVQAKKQMLSQLDVLNGNARIRLNLSIGLSNGIMQDDDSLHELYKQADIKMYNEKFSSNG